MSIDFTQQELHLIARAVRKTKNARLVQGLLLIVTLAAIAGMVAGVVDGDHLVGCLLLAVFVAVAYPQFGGKPKYADLVALLQKKSANAAE